jgi:heme-degrading monooxygenase HmoA
MFARLVTIGSRREQLDEFARIGAEKVLPQLKRQDGFEGSLILANRRSGEIVAVTLWESEEAMRATEGASYWLRAFGAEAAGGEVTGLDRYEVVSSEAWRAHPQPGFRSFTHYLPNSVDTDVLRSSLRARIGRIMLRD